MFPVSLQPATPHTSQVLRSTIGHLRGTVFIFCIFHADLKNAANIGDGTRNDIVLPRFNDYVYTCLFVNIKIKTLGWYTQQ